METKIEEIPALDKKYRPREFSEIMGNTELLASIQSILARPTGIPSSFLLSGPSGCGKTTLARIIAKALGGSESTIKEYNVSNMTGVDSARKIIEHWYLWIIVNSVAVVLFIFRGLYPTVVLYAVYCAMSFIGLREWKKSLIY